MSGNNSEEEGIDITSFLVPAGNPRELTKPKRGNLVKVKQSTQKTQHARKVIDFTKDVDSDAEEESEEEEDFIKKSKNKKGSGGFQNMDLSESVFKAIKHKGYKVPTPIQRKTIPMILEGQDVVGMARTGSGKTASFIIPLIDRLKTHSVQVGIRGLIIAPNRELALQIQKEFSIFAKFTDLRSAVLVGGDSIESQFGQLAVGNPDVVIATPGRLLHLAVEMNLKFDMVEYVVFDEADRLFEMGFALQMHELLYRLPKNRQTLMFSATMPSSLVEFAKAGLDEPSLIRLDAELKMSENLEMSFFMVTSNDKEASLMYLLGKIAREKPGSQTMVFVATKHDVEYTYELLTRANYRCSYIYGSLDQVARQQQMHSFVKKSTQVLIVTDVAARGLDIPILEYVINCNFVDSSKVFIHRVGRVARAGKRGWAYSLVSPQELPYLLDLQLFLDRPLVVGNSKTEYNYATDLVLGQLPAEYISTESEFLAKALNESSTLASLKKVSVNSLKQYTKSKQSASPESYKRAKILSNTEGFKDPHPLLSHETGSDELESARLDMIKSISKYKAKETVFEVTAKKNKARDLSSDIVRKFKKSNVEKIKSKEQTQASLVSLSAKNYNGNNEKDDDYYIPYAKSGSKADKGYELTKGTSFAEMAQASQLSLASDELSKVHRAHLEKSSLRWDPKKKIFKQGTGVGSDNKKLINSESGLKLPASFKSGTYDMWLKKSKSVIPSIGDSETNDSSSMYAKPINSTFSVNNPGKRKFIHTKITPAKVLDKNHINYEKQLKKLKSKNSGRDTGSSMPAFASASNARSELKSAEQIRKERSIKEFRKKRSNGKKPSKPNKSKTSKFVPKSKLKR
ncbi:ATP-dependent RNA helicase dbp10 [Zancudomyces culisetae]|uniref:RNA helicase n=1 Tax=Zancudomyces culisetae TaxID=1213189 RepID=A0A1R1PV57_ZANCU|nr:ATP-dependent RNA helicase dbp10 [Zancudomyces culisetae]OMH86147.1 ATP-dependent RNA helicase dbp10 [Zancudomyces culisetae]|eukprot:OMH84819.1 ATP-dependent RNA helicase dbp10 [Zancudomyces culisetae]